MSVSSVKNLNGNEFSAVQDASLTNVVQTNSGNWNEISAYELASANFITAHQDLSDYQTTAGMTDYYTTAAADTLSSMLSGAIDYVSANAGGTTLTGDAQGAVNNVYTNSSKYILSDAKAVGIGGSLATTNGFAQGGNNKAESYSIAQGLFNSAVGYSIAQGQFCTANDCSIAQGATNFADKRSQAFGIHTTANNSGMAIGYYNNITTGAFVIGNGSAITARNDCFIIDHNGNVSAAGKISANGIELGAGGGGGASYTGDAQGALDKVYANSGNWISTIDNGASSLFFAKKVVQGNTTLYGPVLSASAISWNDNASNKFEIRANRLTLGSDYEWGYYSGYFDPCCISSRGNSNGYVAGNWNWHLDYRGLGGTFSDMNNTTATWSALRNVDLGLTTAGTVSSISGHSLTMGSVNNIVYTASLPQDPDANTLYLIPEA